MEKFEQFSREKLQGLAEEWKIKQLYGFIDQYITPVVVNHARQGLTSYLYEQKDQFGHVKQCNMYTPTDDELLIGLNEKFPGCSIGVVEEWVDVPTKRLSMPPTRTLKKGIKIDWS